MARSRLVNSSAIGPFSWRWPEGVESYDRGGDVIADVGGTELTSGAASVAGPRSAGHGSGQ